MARKPQPKHSQAPLRTEIFEPGAFQHLTQFRPGAPFTTERELVDALHNEQRASGVGVTPEDQLRLSGPLWAYDMILFYRAKQRGKAH